jgi:hypothetical protein
MDDVTACKAMETRGAVQAGLSVLDLAVLECAFRERMSIGEESLVLVYGCETLLTDPLLFCFGCHGAQRDVGCGDYD